MVTEGVRLVLDVAQFSAAAVTVLLILRIAYVLSANPIGEFTAELIYLRYRELRHVGWMLLLGALVEVGQALLPFLERRRYIGNFPDLDALLDTSQAVLLLMAASITVVVVNRYTHRALDRRIRESMETLAYLEGQRRRRRSAERGDWDSTADDD
ncbi:MAG TPA: hypothetical protein VFH78_15040 [Candidatus Thermoplasmatota archaeon]|nr:hypothetical protein [Candidatus Thermoplasmatota archaeon]